MAGTAYDGDGDYVCRWPTASTTMLGSAVCQTTGSARQRYERGSILVTTNLPFDEWTEVFGSESKTGFALTDAPFVAGG